MEPVVAVIGATGAVGDVFLRVAEQREFPMKQLKLLASARSAGKQLTFRGAPITVEETNERTLEGADIVFVPPVEEVYPPGFDSTVSVGPLNVDSASIRAGWISRSTRLCSSSVGRVLRTLHCWSNFWRS